MEEKKFLESKVNDLQYKIQSLETENSHPSSVDKNLLDRNAYLSTEVEKLKTQLDVLKEENQSLRFNVTNVPSQVKSEKEGELQKEVQSLKRQLELVHKSEGKYEIINENKSLKANVDDLLNKNSQLVKQIEDQGLLISKLHNELSIAAETKKSSQKGEEKRYLSYTFYLLISALVKVYKLPFYNSEYL